MELSQSGGMDRRTFLVRSGSAVAGIGLLSIGGGVLEGCSSSSTPTTTTTTTPKMTKLSLQESYINNAEFAGFYCAAKKGYFAKYGLDVDIVSAGATTDPRQVVANGGALTGVVSETSDMIIGVSQGVPYKCFGASFQQNPGCLMVLANSGIYNIKDLEGKIIGMQDNARQQVIGILESNGVPLDKVTMQVVGDDPTPLVEHKIDAYTAYVFNEPIALSMQGIKTRCYSFSDIGLPGYGDCLIALEFDFELPARPARALHPGIAGGVGLRAGEPVGGRDHHAQGLPVRTEHQAAAAADDSSDPDADERIDQEERPDVDRQRCHASGHQRSKGCVVP